LNRRASSLALGNAIYLSDPPDVVAAKVRRMYTDPARTAAGVPGTVEGNPVFAYHDAFNDRPAEVAELKERYRAGKIGDAEVKQRLTAALNRFLDPVRARRAALEADEGLVAELIVTGTERTRREVRRTLADVRAAMGLTAALAAFRRAARGRPARRGLPAPGG
jgi:tryptophanyl-tRNA synthetase